MKCFHEDLENLKKKTKKQKSRDGRWHGTGWIQMQSGHRTTPRKRSRAGTECVRACGGRREEPRTPRSQDRRASRVAEESDPGGAATTPPVLSAPRSWWASAYLRSRQDPGPGGTDGKNHSGVRYSRPGPPPHWP